MENIYTKLCLIIFIFSGLLNNVFAQAPEGILFQAEARDEKGKIIAKEMLNVKIKIHQDDPTGFVVWDEEHAVTTDNNGLFTIVIGEGVSSYIFSDIDWAEHTHFLEVQVKDPKTLRSSL